VIIRAEKRYEKYNTVDYNKRKYSKWESFYSVFISYREDEKHKIILKY